MPTLKKNTDFGQSNARPSISIVTRQNREADSNEVHNELVGINEFFGTHVHHLEYQGANLTLNGVKKCKDVIRGMEPSQLAKENNENETVTMERNRGKEKLNDEYNAVST